MNFDEMAQKAESLDEMLETLGLTEEKINMSIRSALTDENIRVEEGTNFFEQNHYNDEITKEYRERKIAIKKDKISLSGHNDALGILYGIEIEYDKKGKFGKAIFVIKKDDEESSKILNPKKKPMYFLNKCLFVPEQNKVMKKIGNILISYQRKENQEVLKVSNIGIKEQPILDITKTEYSITTTGDMEKAKSAINSFGLDEANEIFQAAYKVSIDLR